MVSKYYANVQKSFSFWGTSSPRPTTGALPLDHGGLPKFRFHSYPICIKWQSSPFASVYGCVLVMTYSWLDDNDKNFGPDLPLLFKMHKFAQFILRKIIKFVATRCQILRLKCTKFVSVGAPPQTLPGELTVLSQPSSWIQEAYF